MKPITAFNEAIKRAEHLMTLYDIIRDTRQRDIRRDWAEKFNEHMQWPKNEKIVRIDGKDKKTLLILREDLKITRDQFTHDYCSELLRAALVNAVSALDRYIHDLIVDNSLKILAKKEEDIPKEFKKLKISVVEVEKAIKRVRANSRARPRSQVKKALQEMLHQDFTFQNSSNMDKAAGMLGIKNFWGNVSSHMKGRPEKKDIQRHLKNISLRRNQIVHEADIVKKVSSKKLTLRDIKFKDAQDIVDWINDFVKAVNKIEIE